MLADDIKIFCCVNNQEDAVLLQEYLNDLYKWCTNNKFTLISNKCQIMTII